MNDLHITRTLPTTSIDSVKDVLMSLGCTVISTRPTPGAVGYTTIKYSEPRRDDAR